MEEVRVGYPSEQAQSQEEYVRSLEVERQLLAEERNVALLRAAALQRFRDADRATIVKLSNLLAQVTEEARQDTEALHSENDALRKKLREVRKLHDEPSYTRKAKVNARTGIKRSLNNDADSE